MLLIQCFSLLLKYKKMSKLVKMQQNVAFPAKYFKIFCGGDATPQRLRHFDVLAQNESP